jgi:hypothetical protein
MHKETRPYWNDSHCLRNLLVLCGLGILWHVANSSVHAVQDTAQGTGQAAKGAAERAPCGTVPCSTGCLI